MIELGIEYNNVNTNTDRVEHYTRDAYLLMCPYQALKVRIFGYREQKSALCQHGVLCA